MQSAFGEQNSLSLKRKSSSGQDLVLANKRKCVTSTYYPPPSKSPNVTTITTSNGEKIELVDEVCDDRYLEQSCYSEDSLLLPCRVRRNYACKACSYATTNPRLFLYHMRDAHAQKGNIHECPYCMYASVHSHKLLRHISLVHRVAVDSNSEQANYQPSPSASTTPNAFPHLSADRMPLPPDLEVILVEDDPSPSTSVVGARKTVKPMLMEPSVVFLPLNPQQQAAPPPLQPSLPPLHRRKIHPRHHIQHSSLPPPPLLSSLRPPPPLFNSAAKPSQPQRKASSEEAPAKDKVLEEFSCSVCTFKSKSRVLVQRHEKVSHLKKKFFRCTKCNYVTSVRARYTKHVRYHDMPYIKCETCDFSTPYKWNLDRHRRNHLEEGDTLEGGAPAGLEVFRCYKCTFSTLSKQSLSVHLLNHHSEGGGYRRPRRMDENANNSNSVTPPSPAVLEHRQEPEQPAENKVTRNEPAEDTEEEEEEEEEEEDKEEDEDGEEEEEAETGSVDVEEIDDNEDEAENDSSSKPYACVECRETFPSVSLLDRHAYEFHEIEHPRRPPERKRTMAKRPDGKPKVKCDLCPYEAKWISEVVRHRRVHIQDKPYSCPHCEFRSRWKGDMTRHIMKYHGGDGETALELNASGKGEEERSKNPEVNNFEQLLDQSMMVGGEEDLHIYNGRMPNPPPPAPPVPAQDLPLDLSRPIEEVNIFSHSRAKDSNTGLLPFLLRIPPRRIPQQEINMPIHLSPSLQLIPTSRPASTMSSTTQKIMAPPSARAQRTLTISPSIAVLPVPKVQVPMNTSISVRPVSPEKSDKSVNAPIIRKTFQCPYCTYSTTTASRFHMHIVVHLNQKPYMCSECGYRSNWQWDITKHSKMKAPRDPRHASASVIVVNDSGNKNYEKYEKYAVYETLITKSKKKVGQAGLESPAASESTGNSGGRTTLLTLPTTSSTSVQLLPLKPANVRSRVTKKITFKCKYCEFRHTIRRNIIRHMSVHSGNKPFWCGICGQSSNCRNVILRHCHVRHGAPGPIMQREEGKSGSKAMPYPPGVNGELGFEIEEEEVEELIKMPETPGLDRPDVPLPPPPPVSSPPVIKASDSTVQDESVNLLKPPTEAKEDKSKRHKCSVCPYRCRKLFDLRIHSYMHKPHEGANFKCMFCPFYVSLKRSWLQHMKLHVDQPHEYIKHCQEGMPPPLQPPIEPELDEKSAPNLEIPSKIPTTPVATSTPKLNSPKFKRYCCEQCPYRTDSHTTFLYHRQFHRPGRTGVFKCTYCSYAVSKSHLLMQHLRLHEVAEAPSVEKVAAAPLPTPATPCSPPTSPASGFLENPPSVPNVCRVWVQRDGVFKKMFKCSHCPHISMKRAVITDHEKMHYKRKSTLGKATFMCNLCNYTCKNSGALTSHQRMHREHENSLGYISEKDYASAHAAAKPKATKSISPAKQENEVITPVPITISTEERWTRISTGGKQFFTCGKCPAKFTKPQQMAFHRALHGAAFKWKCSSCDYAARHRPHLHKHAKVHTPEYQSDYKPDGSKRASSGEIFLTKKAGTETIGNSTPPGSPTSNSGLAKKETCSPLKGRALDNGRAVVKKNYSCHLCPSVFFKYSTLVYHLHLHGSNAKFKCQHCTYAVANIGNLVRHAKVHLPATKSNASPVHGSLPSKGVSSMENGEKCQLVCPKCPAVFEKKLRYDIHVGLHGSKQRFQCDRCDYAVQFAANMVRHRRMHADEEKKTMANGYTSPSNTNSKNGSKATYSESKAVNDLLEETLKSVGDANITPVEKQQLLLQKLQNLHARKTIAKVPKEEEDPSATVAEPKKLFRCERCPYSSQRKDAVQSHMRRHVTLPAFESTCPHCDYGSSLTSFLKEHIKLHFKPFRFHQVDAFVEWEEFEIWAKFGNTKRLIYRHSVDGKEFTEEDVYEVSASSSPAPREEDEEELDRMEEDAEECVEKAPFDAGEVESVMNSLLDKVENVEEEISGEATAETSNSDMYEDISACDSTEETMQDNDFVSVNETEMRMDTSYGIMKLKDRPENVEDMDCSNNRSSDAINRKIVERLKDDECRLTTSPEGENDEKSKDNCKEPFISKESVPETSLIVDNLSNDV